jgi:hypothetical protein
MAKADITAQRLRELLDYDLNTGVFTWRVTRKGHRKAGDAAGYLRKDRYVIIGLDNATFLGHRLAWLHVYGEWPREHLDHIDGNPTNNRIENLRDVSPTVNGQNRKRVHRNTVTGFLGVDQVTDGLWGVRIKVDGRIVKLSGIRSEKLAQECSVALRRILQPGCTL